MAGLIRGEAGRVTYVSDGDQLALDTGLTVRLAEIEAPRRAWREREGDPFGEEAFGLLEMAALAREAQLYYGGLTRDRYERAIAHVVVRDEAGSEIWLNAHMAEQGGARIRTWPDNVARVSELLALEQAARRAGRGLWALPDYALLSPKQLSRAGRGLAIVEGRVDEIADISEGESEVLATPQNGLSLRLGYRLARSDERIGLQPGDRIRVRGGARSNDDGAVVLKPDHWSQFELTGETEGDA